MLCTLLFFFNVFSKTCCCWIKWRKICIINVSHALIRHCVSRVYKVVYNYLVEHSFININDVIVMAVTGPRTRMKDDIAKVTSWMFKTGADLSAFRSVPLAALRTVRLRQQCIRCLCGMWNSYNNVLTVHTLSGRSRKYCNTQLMRNSCTKRK